MSQLGELFIELGVFADTKELEGFEKKLKKVSDKIDDTTKKNDKLTNSISKTISGIVAFGTAVIAAAVTMNKLTNDLVKSNQAMLDLTRTTDIALNTFQKWNGVGKLFGVENAAQQLAGLNERLFELKLTGQGARGFQLAGINPAGMDANGVLEQLRSRVAGMDDTTASYLLSQMGLDPKMLYLLRMGKGEFEELGRIVKRYQLTEKQRFDIQKMNIEIQIAITKLQYFKDRIILAIMPIWTKFINSIARILGLFAKLVSGVKKMNAVWHGFFVALAYGLSRLKSVQTIFKSIAAAISGLITKIPILGRLLASIGAIGARILLPLTALFLLLDDIATYADGGDSLIGRVEAWMKDGNKDFLDRFIDVGNTIITLLESIVNILTFGFYDKAKEGLESSGWRRFLFPTVDEVKEDALNRLYAPKYTPSNSVNNNTDNRQVNQNVMIHTNQPANDIYRELLGANYQFAN